MRHYLKSALPKATAVAIPLLIVLSYLLSFGPARMLVSNGKMEHRTFATLYAPIIVAHDQWEPTRDVVNWYLAQWIWMLEPRHPLDPN